MAAKVKAVKATIDQIAGLIEEIESFDSETRVEFKRQLDRIHDFVEGKLVKNPHPEREWKTPDTVLIEGIINGFLC